MVFDRALAGANLAPDPLLGDPGPAWLQERHRRLEALEEWFVRGRSGAPPNMERLRRQGRDWVLSFLKVLEVLEIANFMRERFSAVVRMDADVYRAARGELAPPWEHDVPKTPWCPELREAIRGRGSWSTRRIPSFDTPTSRTPG